ncbi:hypothetical protein [Rubrobacter aplysinae]|uniref:hypothetical protein n=1 Tax=Rubrobacter aplysinae TaxID=909625 RepID=UPI00064C38CE|nr:hypothetical protein [Rubrobacter aplysinae]
MTSVTSVSSVTLGLVPAPDLPAKVAYELAPELPALLGRHIDQAVQWEVPVIVDPLTGGEEEAPQILDETWNLKRREGWDMAISITDLPMHRDGRVLVANASVDRGLGGISLPALGATLLRRRVREAVLQLASEIRWGSSESDRDRQKRLRHTQAGDRAGVAGEERLRGRGPRQLVGRRLTERLAPIKRVTTTDETGVDVRYLVPGMRGHVRLLSGMVLSNNPFALFATMKGSLVAAFATGTYALIFSSVRVLSDSFGPLRLVAFMILSIMAIGLWLVISYGLWERPYSRKSPGLSRLYNTVTALTLGVSVLSLYAALLVLAFLAAMFLVPADLFQTTIGHPPRLGDYLSLASVVASLAMIAGSLGLRVEDRETVLRATYGYRQRRRIEAGKKAKTSSVTGEDTRGSPEYPEPWRIHRRNRGRGDQGS